MSKNGSDVPITKCPLCDGHQWLWAGNSEYWRRCDNCNGRGWVYSNSLIAPHLGLHVEKRPSLATMKMINGAGLSFANRILPVQLQPEPLILEDQTSQTQVQRFSSGDTDSGLQNEKLPAEVTGQQDSRGLEKDGEQLEQVQQCLPARLQANQEEMVADSVDRRQPQPLSQTDDWPELRHDKLNIKNIFLGSVSANHPIRKARPHLQEFQVRALVQRNLNATSILGAMREKKLKKRLPTAQPIDVVDKTTTSVPVGITPIVLGCDTAESERKVGKGPFETAHVVRVDKKPSSVPVATNLNSAVLHNCCDSAKSEKKMDPHWSLPPKPAGRLDERTSSVPVENPMRPQHRSCYINLTQPTVVVDKMTTSVLEGTNLNYAFTRRGCDSAKNEKKVEIRSFKQPTDTVIELSTFLSKFKESLSPKLPKTLDLSKKMISSHSSKNEKKLEESSLFSKSLQIDGTAPNGKTAQPTAIVGRTIWGDFRERMADSWTKTTPSFSSIRQMADMSNNGPIGLLLGTSNLPDWNWSLRKKETEVKVSSVKEAAVVAGASEVLLENSPSSAVLLENSQSSEVLLENSNSSGVLPENSNSSGVLPKNSKSSGVLPENSRSSEDPITDDAEDPNDPLTWNSDTKDRIERQVTLIKDCHFNLDQLVPEENLIEVRNTRSAIHECMKSWISDRTWKHEGMSLATWKEVLFRVLQDIPLPVRRTWEKILSEPVTCNGFVEEKRRRNNEQVLSELSKHLPQSVLGNTIVTPRPFRPKISASKPSTNLQSSVKQQPWWNKIVVKVNPSTEEKEDPPTPSPEEDPPTPSPEEPVPKKKRGRPKGSTNKSRRTRTKSWSDY